ncbi:MAG: glycoside hydrolase family 9 protein [Candidatus Lokiarchaeota archaeon]|nr:glycoside hydrolase family 9 protein [Candidatus Lokiarchaeota archaeon]
MNKIDRATIVPASIGSASVVLGLVLPAIPFLTAFLGWYVWVLAIPMIVGGALCISGGLLANWNEDLAYVLVMLGGLVGIVTLLALPSLRLIRVAREDNQRRPPHYLLVMPVLVAYALFAMFLVDLQDKTHVPITQLGRNGLPLADTIWDADVFFGELWFNLLLACMLVAMLSFKIHPQNDSAWKLTPARERLVLVASGLVSVGLLVSMAATWQPSFSVSDNWYPTQFAYQVPAWPAVIGFAGLVIGTLNIKKGGSGRCRAGWFFVMLFLAIWLYLTSITDFNPHAIFNFSIPLHVVVTTAAFPCCLVVYAVERMKARPETNVPSAKRPGLLFLPVLIGGLALMALLQVLPASSAQWVGYGDFFSPEIYWWWPLSHAWGWLFTGSTALFVLFALKAFSRWHRARREPRQTAMEVVPRARLGRAIAALLLAGTVLGGTFPVLFVTSAQWSARERPMLLVNQVGYLPSAPKRVLFQSATEQHPVPETAAFSVIDEATGLPVYDGTLARNVTNRYGHNYMLGSFDAVVTSGRYHVRATVDGEVHTSPSFDIGPGVYDAAAELALRFFYYQRCNYEVLEVVPGYDGHHACHLDDADVWDGSEWVHHDLTGGWHDAGDYNKYNSWFQTQWYCMQALAECALVDPGGLYSNVTSLYDTPAADAFDEALWGAKYLANCVNVEGLQGAQYQYRIWETVSGFRQQSEREARMSYWGPAELDWTAPRRVVFNEHNSTFVGYRRGYAIAGSLLQVARLIDTYQAAHPGLQIPTWFPWNATYLRQLADSVYAKHLEVQGGASDDIQSYIGKFLYAEENGTRNGHDWAVVDALVPSILSNVANIVADPLWFSWAGYYALGNILTHYATRNRTVPAPVMTKLAGIEADHFANLFDEPFRVKHGRVTAAWEPIKFNQLLALDDPAITASVNSLLAGENVLFFGAERQTDMLTSAWLQLLACHVNATGERPELVQSYLDWLFGVNPAGLCLMEGVGSRNLAQYHHRYSWARYPSGAVPGCIPNGLAPATASNDYARARGFTANDSNFLAVLGDRCQYGDWPGNPLVRDGVPSNPNEVWIPHDAMFLRILTMMSVSGLFK